VSEPNIDLSPELVRTLCKGDVKQLPRLCVHDNEVWPASVMRIDTKNRIHMCRLDFEHVVAPSIPVREGLWLRVDMQEFFIDLRPDQLGGDADQHSPTTAAERRALVMADDAARIPAEEDYGDNALASRAPARAGELPATLSESSPGASGSLPRRPGDEPRDFE